MEDLNEEERVLLAEIEGRITEPPKPTNNLYNVFHRLVGNDLCVIFGDSGSGKTRTCFQLATDSISRGKKVLYIDTEGNLSGDMIDTLKSSGVEYRRTTDHITTAEVVDRARGFDVLIVDSATLFITGKWYDLDRGKRGGLLQHLQGMYHSAKIKCEKEKMMAIMVAQPRSDYGDNKSIEPMGDKAQFMTKVIIRVICTRSVDGKPMKRSLVIFRSRNIEDGTHFSYFTTTLTGICLTEWDNIRRVVG